MPSGSCPGCNARTSGREGADKRPSHATKQPADFEHSIKTIVSRTRSGNNLTCRLSNFIQESQNIRAARLLVKKQNAVMDVGIGFGHSHLTTLSERILAQELAWPWVGHIETIRAALLQLEIDHYGQPRRRN